MNEDSVAMQARHDAELEIMRSSTIPCAPPDFEETASKARIYTSACELKGEVDRLVNYLAGRLNGVEVDIAQLQPLHPAVTQLLDGQKAILEALEKLAASVARIEYNQRLTNSEVRTHGQLIALTSRRKSSPDVPPTGGLEGA